MKYMVLNLPQEHRTTALDLVQMIMFCELKPHNGFLKMFDTEDYTNFVLDTRFYPYIKETYQKGNY